MTHIISAICAIATRIGCELSQNCSKLLNCTTAWLNRLKLIEDLKGFKGDLAGCIKYVNLLFQTVLPFKNMKYAQNERLPENYVLRWFLWYISWYSLGNFSLINTRGPHFKQKWLALECVALQSNRLNFWNQQSHNTLEPNFHHHCQWFIGQALENRG